MRAPLGAGKTVLAKGIARGLDVRDVVTSPTFTVVSEYSGRLHLVHVDLYRIHGPEEFEQLAVEDLVDERSVVLVEWPERAGDALPRTTRTIRLEIEADGSRLAHLPDELTAAPASAARDPATADPAGESS